MEMTPAGQAVEALIHEYGKLVFHTIYGLTNDWEESQDLTQDTFHQALRSIDAARAASGAQFHAKAWLLRIALNTVRMQQRRRSLFRFIPFSQVQDQAHEQPRDEGQAEAIQGQALPVQPIGYGAATSGDPAEIIVERDVVQRTMARLPEPLRVCLLLSIVGGLSTSEMALLLDLNEAAVRQRLSRARKQFQTIYAQEGGAELAESSEARAVDPPTGKYSATELSTRDTEKDARKGQAAGDKGHSGQQFERFTLATRPSIG